MNKKPKPKKPPVPHGGGPKPPNVTELEARIAALEARLAAVEARPYTFPYYGPIAVGNPMGEPIKYTVTCNPDGWN